MTDEHDIDDGPNSDAQYRAAVQRELTRLRGFLGQVSLDEVRSGDWFGKLLTFSMTKYVTKVDASYFREKYPDLPADAVAQARIQMASRYASLAGALTASAYSGTIAATIGSGGAASPLTLPAAGTTFVVDLAFISQLQLRLAYDISVLYQVPLDLDDPDDLWKLIRIAFGIKAGEIGGEAALKGVPVVVRPIVKKIFSGATLQATKSLPVVGKYLLQRNIIKFAIPVVSIPITTAVNYWLTRVNGRQALRAFRTEAKIIEAADRLTRSTVHHEQLLWVLWLIIQADGSIQEGERSLLHRVTRQVRATDPQLEALTHLRDVVEVDEEMVWSLLERTSGDLAPIYAAGSLAAAVDGKASKPELDTLRRLADVCGVDYDDSAIRKQAKSWS